ncbi:hypothetical protein [Pseudomonas sp. ICMP 561]|uniref:hypothetical protein n=1 Tax=Pseudomonas sp. ICMP 561 TaxID=1718918 RepID=UPI000C08542F|nr:hypothetical protein [Pseudomonas sp. ICMP 561]PHN17154.1 hypothetical protein AO242_20865 [Pseudomonas sp. ICMP 561]
MKYDASKRIGDLGELTVPSMLIKIDPQRLIKAENAISVLDKEAIDSSINNVTSNAGIINESTLTSQTLPEKFLDLLLELGYATEAGQEFHILTINIEKLIDELIEEENRWRQNKDLLSDARLVSLFEADCAL